MKKRYYLLLVIFFKYIGLQSMCHDSTNAGHHIYNSASQKGLFHSVRLWFMLKISRYNIESTDTRQDGYSNFQATPLFFACLDNQPIVVAKLLKYGANVNCESSRGEKPINIVLGNCYHRMYALNSPKIFDDQDFNETVYRDSLECLQILIDNEGNINASNYKGDTALHYAVELANIHDYPQLLDPLNLLIKNNANLESKNNENKTPRDLATLQGVKKLLEKPKNRTRMKYARKRS